MTDLDRLAREVVTCPRWRLLPGMLVWCSSPGSRAEYDWNAEDVGASRWTAKRLRRLADAQPGMCFADGSRGAGAPEVWVDGAWFPDLTDPATVTGCLLALVREAHSSLQSTEYVGDGDPVNPWRWGSFKGRSEAEALVAALRGAP